PELAHQVAAFYAFCPRRGEHAGKLMEELGCGLNSQRKQFNRLLESTELGQVRQLVIARQDRLVRFGFGWFAASCALDGTQLLMVNGDTLSPEHALGQDVLSIVQVFSVRLYVLRPCKKVIRDAAVYEDPAPGKRC